MYHYLKYALFIFTVILSFIIHFSVDRFIPVSEQLLVNNTFSHGSRGWETKHNSSESQIQFQPNHLILSTYTQTSIQTNQTILPDNTSPYYLLKADVKTDNITQGPLSWNMGRILLVQYKGEKPQWSIKHSLVALDKTNTWITYSNVFSIDPETTKIQVVAQIRSATGKLHCKNIELYRVLPNPTFHKLKTLVYCIWGGLFIFILLPYFKAAHIYPKISIIILTLTLLFGVTMNANLKEELKTDIEHNAPDVFKQIDTYSADQPVPLQKTTESVHQNGQFPQSDVQNKPNSSFTFKIDITKLAHFLLFMGLGTVLIWNKPLFIQQTLLDLLLIACGTETLQLFIEGRSALLSDVGIDFMGGLTGVIIGLFLLKLRAPKQRP